MAARKRAERKIKRAMIDVRIRKVEYVNVFEAVMSPAVLLLNVLYRWRLQYAKTLVLMQAKVARGCQAIDAQTAERGKERW